MEDKKWISLAELSRSTNIGIRTDFADAHKVETSLLSLGCLQRIANAVERLAETEEDNRIALERSIREERMRYCRLQMFSDRDDKVPSKIWNSVDYICDFLFIGTIKHEFYQSCGIRTRQGMCGSLYFNQVIDFNWNDKSLLRRKIRGKVIEAHAIRFDEWRVSVGLPKLFPFLPRKTKKPTKRKPSKKQEQQTAPTP